MGLNWNKIKSRALLFSKTWADACNEDSQAIKHFAQVKRDEIECFIAGFFQGEDKIKLPPEIGESLDVLEDLVGMFAGVVAIPKKTHEGEVEILGLMNELQKVADIAQKEINIIIISSAQARRQGGTPSRVLH